MAIWLHGAYWISKATRAEAHASALPPTPAHTHTHIYSRTRTERLIALLRHQWFRERTSALHYTCVYCLSC